MIRRWQSRDVAPLLALWRESSVFAHPFIDPQYWHENEVLVRDDYLPASKTWVWQEAERIVGFISIMEPCVVGALFVAPNAIGRGIGRALLGEVCERYPDLTLEVYQQNARAVRFYTRMGFQIEASGWQADAGHPTWIMRRRADRTP